MEEIILKILKETTNALSYSQLKTELEINTKEREDNFNKLLKKMQDNLQIYKTKRDNFMIYNNANIKIGTFISNKKGFGFVDIKETEDVFINPRNTNNALHGDKVVVELTKIKDNSLEGRIIKTIERTLKQLVGEIIMIENIMYLKSDNEKVSIEVEIDKNKTNGALEGNKVIVKLGRKIKQNLFKGEVIKILGHKNDPGVDILSITSSLEIPDIFSEETLKEIENIKDEVQSQDEIGRKDLTEEIIFTIDGDDTKDIDDAISIYKEKDYYTLGVHIADVSYYVRPNTSLDNEARERGTSVYLADRVIPMLPHKLSNGICSLNPKVKRLAITCQMKIDKKGNIIEKEVYPSVIKSQIQMTYNNVNKVIDNNEIPEGYESFVDKLKLMDELAIVLRNYKKTRGYLDFDLEEAKIIVDEKGKAIDVKLRTRGTGEKMIEDFMIAANEAVAEIIYEKQLPSVYRVHGQPSEDKLANFMRFISILGYNIKGDFDTLKPTDMQKILDQLRDKKEFSILSSLLLRSMQKAIYDTVNIGHFGIASTCYTHFTSPIRRYPDTTIHRLLHKYIFNKDTTQDTVKFYERELPEITLHSSETERRSVECERQVADMKKAEYMEQHIGEEFDGVITSIMPFGMFVELSNLIEGLVKTETLKDDLYTYDEKTFSMIGKNNKRGFRLGDQVKVKTVASSKEKRKIDFEVV